MHTSGLNDTNQEEINHKEFSGWQLRPSKLAQNTHNRIRQIVESLKIEPNPEKPMIPLSIGKYRNCTAMNKYCSQTKDECMELILRNLLVYLYLASI